MDVREDGITSVDVPTEESGLWEFKSSQTRLDELAAKLGRAASAFWNSGGGNFVAGVGEDGKADGGIPSLVGRQSIRDWVDRAIAKVLPPGPYQVAVLPVDDTVEDRVVVIVRFRQSHAAPHMAPDHRYYVRLGAHTEPATQFIIEALWAGRRRLAPVIAHAFKVKPQDPNIVQLAIVALTDEPAFNLELVLEPVPTLWKDKANPFPLSIPLLTRDLPLEMDVTLWRMAKENFGEPTLTVRYHDLGGKQFEYVAKLSADKALTPYRIRDQLDRDRLDAVQTIGEELKHLRHDLADQRDRELKRRRDRYRFPLR